MDKKMSTADHDYYVYRQDMLWESPGFTLAGAIEEAKRLTKAGKPAYVKRSDGAIYDPIAGWITPTGAL